MSTVIAMAYLSYAPEIHLTSSGAATSRRSGGSRTGCSAWSGRASGHRPRCRWCTASTSTPGPRWSRTSPSPAASRPTVRPRSSATVRSSSGRPAGLAMTHLEMGELEAAGTWLDRAAAAALAAPTPGRARQLEMWRGIARAALGEAEGMRTHLERAVEMATERVGPPPAARPWPAWRSRPRGSASTRGRRPAPLAEQAAVEAKDAWSSLPVTRRGARRPTPRWPRWRWPGGDPEAAAVSGGAAAAFFQEAHAARTRTSRSCSPAARAILAAGAEETSRRGSDVLQLVLGRSPSGRSTRTSGSRWLRGPLGRRARRAGRAARRVRTATRGRRRRGRAEIAADDARAAPAAHRGHDRQRDRRRARLSEEQVAPPARRGVRRGSAPRRAPRRRLRAPRAAVRSA